MSKITIDMPLVKSCSATECAYNSSRSCHAKAITVGDSELSRCDTFFRSPDHNRETKRVAGVGACKMGTCQYNSDFECTASGITVGSSQGSIQCLTFRAREAVA